MIQLSVDVENPYRLQAWLTGAPALFLSALRGATRKGVDLLEQGIRPFTPVRTGLLMGSYTTRVRDRSDGALGTVSTDVREGRYVEFGTRQHGRAQHMFMKGSIASREAIGLIYDYEIRALAASFGR